MGFDSLTKSAAGKIIRAFFCSKSKISGRIILLTVTGRRIFITNNKIVKDDTPMNSISKQLKFDSSILPVVGNYEYDQYQRELDLMDDICRSSGLDDNIAKFILDMKQQNFDDMRISKGLPPKPFTADKNNRLLENAQTLFRAALLRKYTTESLRVFCRNVADSPLRQRFCGINRFVAAEIFSKSQLEPVRRSHGL